MWNSTYLYVSNNLTFLKFLILKFQQPTSHATCTATYIIGYLLLVGDTKNIILGSMATESTC